MLGSRVAFADRPRPREPRADLIWLTSVEGSPRSRLARVGAPERVIHQPRMDGWAPDVRGWAVMRFIPAAVGDLPMHDAGSTATRAAARGSMPIPRGLAWPVARDESTQPLLARAMAPSEGPSEGPSMASRRRAAIDMTCDKDAPPHSLA